MRRVLLSALFFSSFGFPGAITVHNTGVDGSNALVALGAQASFWTLASEPMGAAEPINPFRFHHPAYFADQATAAWVAPTSSGNAGPGGNYVYDLIIDLTGLDASTAVITGKFASDNDGSISLNGNAPVLITGFADFGSYPSSANFIFNSGFVSGLNTIHATVNNGGDPTAFYVEFLSATANSIGGGGIPEPTTLVLSGVGIAGLIFARRRRAP